MFGYTNSATRYQERRILTKFRIFTYFVITVKITRRTQNIVTMYYTLCIPPPCKLNFTARGAPKEGGGGRAAAPTKPPKTEIQKTEIFKISDVLPDFPFSRNQPLKSAHDCTLEF
jgi:hypothetical protein